MNVRYPKFSFAISSLFVALLSVLAPSISAQTEPANAPVSASTESTQKPNGQAILRAGVRQTSQRETIQARMRVRTDMLGQPLIGSGSYSQLRASVGVLLRMELAIQAGEQATSVKQISNGRDLYELWRIGGKEHLNHIDLRVVDAAIQQAPAGAVTSSTSSSLASGGLPKLLQQLEENFDFSKANVSSEKLGDVPVMVLTGVWRAERLAAAAPKAVENDAIHFDKLPIHLPHQVEVLLGHDDLFPYRVTYHRWQPQDGKHVLKPAVTTEFFEVTFDEEVDSTQFDFKPNMKSVERTDAFLKTLGLKPTSVAKKLTGDQKSR